MKNGFQIKFPQISRFFSANKFILWGIFSLITITSVVMLYSHGNSTDVLGSQNHIQPTPHQSIESDNEYAYWLTIINDYPDYRDGFVYLAILAYQRGDIEASWKYIQKIRSLDPNFERLQELEDLVQNK